MLLNKFQKTSSIILILSILATIACSEPAPEPDAATYIENGDSLFNEARYIEAVAEYTKAIELNPNLESAYMKRADAYTVHLRRYEKSIEDYTKAIQINPNNDNAYSYRALNYLSIENYDLAIKDGEKALQINPNNAVGYYIIGKGHYGRGEYQKAIDKYNKSLETDPPYTPALLEKEIAERMLKETSGK